MRMKYYLRGMGIGIMVTVLIFMIALIFYQPNLSDAEVIRRAGALGMVMPDEGTTVADASGEVSDSSGTEAIVTGSETDGGASDGSETDSGASGDGADTLRTTDGTDDGDTSDTDISDTDTSARPVVTVETNEETVAADGASTSSDGSGSTGSSVSGETASVNIAGGDSSESVSRKLVQAGIVSDADEYNTYLVTHGYDRTLQNGTFSIPAGSSYEDIARIITRSN